MKKFTAFLLALILPVILFGCKDNGDLGKQTTVDTQNNVTIYAGTGMFKMNDDERAMKKLDGVQKDGFKLNMGDEGIAPVKTRSDVLDAAKKEATVKYNSIRVAFDRTRGIWRVVFGNDTEKEVDGQKQISTTALETVYIDEDGYTLAIYKGEVK